jgi:hypothetical protein
MHWVLATEPGSIIVPLFVVLIALHFLLFYGLGPR